MSQPANPPPYDAIYTQGAPTYPVQTQPQPHVILQVPPSTQQTVYRRDGVYDNSMDLGPTTVVCQSCHYLIETRIEIRPGFRTHACAVCFCVLGLWPCCFIPYCIPSCNNVDHYCPKCNAYIGAYRG